MPDPDPQTQTHKPRLTDPDPQTHSQPCPLLLESLQKFSVLLEEVYVIIYFGVLVL